MLRKSCWVMFVAWASLWLSTGSSRADDYEDELLNKFQNQNKSIGIKLKHDVTRFLQQESSSQEIEPLRKLLGQLQEDTFLPREERMSLIRQLRDRLLEGEKLAQKSTPEPLPSFLDKKPSQSFGTTSTRDPKIKVKPVVLFTNGGSVLVPDRGSRELAGYSYYADSRNEYGVPGLGKIPYVSRLFRNVGYSSVSGGASISVSVRIIMMEEEEEALRNGR
jgi:hypothetical protein